MLNYITFKFISESFCKSLSSKIVALKYSNVVADVKAIWKNQLQLSETNYFNKHDHVTMLTLPAFTASLIRVLSS